MRGYCGQREDMLQCCAALLHSMEVLLRIWHHREPCLVENLEHLLSYTEHASVPTRRGGLQKIHRLT